MIHLVCRTGIRTHDLLNTSRFPQPLDQSSRAFIVKFWCTIWATEWDSALWKKLHKMGQEADQAPPQIFSIDPERNRESKASARNEVRMVLWIDFSYKSSFLPGV